MHTKKAITKANQNNLREQKLPCNVAVDGHKPVKRQSARKVVKEMSNMEQIEVIVAEAMKCGMSYGEFIAKNPHYAARLSQIVAIKKKRGQKQREINNLHKMRTPESEKRDTAQKCYSCEYKYLDKDGTPTCKNKLRPIIGFGCYRRKIYKNQGV